MKCALCGKEFKGYSHNGQPLTDGPVGDCCNWKVIQARLKELKDHEKPEEVSANETHGVENLQLEVDSQLRKYGRIGGGLYDKIDEQGFFIDKDNKVKPKSSTESMAVIGTDGPNCTVDPMADFEKYAKQFEDMFILGKTPIRKEEPKNTIKEKDGELVGEIDSVDEGNKAEQAEPIKEESATEAIHSFGELMEAFKLCKEIGIETFGDLSKFMKENPGLDTLEALRKYREELGPEFKIKEA